jgi:aspartyl/asparaginyl beta-hydroxylase (cupin superfamily)
MDYKAQEQFIDRIQNNIDFFREQYFVCKKHSFAFWDLDNPNKRIPHWKTTILWWKQKPFKPVQQLVPETVEILKTGPSHRATGWMELDPNSSVPKHSHQDWGERYILHIPIIIPNGELKFCVEGQRDYSWKENELFVFDARKKHSAVNNTNQSRVILGLDFDKGWKEVLHPFMQT